MNTDARRPDALASGREPTALVVAPPTPVRARPGRPPTVACRLDAPRAVPSGRPVGAAVPSSEVAITVTTTGVAR